MNVKIRLMNINDYDKVYKLWLSCKGMGLNNLDDSKEGIDKFLKRNPETCFVAEEKDEIVWVILAGNDGRRGHIDHTAVSPNYRKKGIGRNLVIQAMNALKNLGINKTNLVVFSNNIEGNLFWEKLGFSQRNDLIYRDKLINEMEKINT